MDTGVSLRVDETGDVARVALPRTAHIAKLPEAEAKETSDWVRDRKTRDEVAKVGSALSRAHGGDCPPRGRRWRQSSL